MSGSARVLVLSAALAAPLLTAAVVHAQQAATPRENRLFHREQLTGDWGGLRTDWKNKGFELDVSLAQFYQTITEGGSDQNGEYNGNAHARVKFDLGKLIGWKFWQAEIKAETRFGGPFLTGTGGINPTNTAVMIPHTEGTVFSFTAVNFTKLFPIDLEKGKLIALAFGRFNFIDIVNEEFFAGGGIDRFLNIAQIGPLTVSREVPLISNSVSLAYLRDGVPFISVALIDPNDHSLDPGLSDLFADGVSFSPGINLESTFFGKSGMHTFGGAITTKEYTPFDVIRQIIIPGPAVNPVQPQTGSWSVSYTLRQYIVERAPNDGWGLFGQLSFANQSTSPITTFIDVGLGGNGLFENRSRDEFGIAYAYTDLSDELKDNLDLLPLGGRVEAEQHVEVYYNIHLTPWLQLTGDVQFIDPVRPSLATAIVPGGRLRIVF